jgi:predicted metalloprotease with PDZ domain
MRSLPPLAPLLTLAALLSLAPAARSDFAPGTITLAVDATDAPKKILHARTTIPVAPGPLSLSYPKWIPGEHGPTGPLTDLAGLRVTAGGRSIPWQRDLVDMYAIHVTVPAGARSVEVSFDFLLAAGPVGFSSAASATEKLLLLSWNQVLLYPSGQPSDALTYAASLRLPSGWKHGTPLPAQRESGGVIRFAPASLTTLVDSPVIAGEHFRTVDLAPGAAEKQVIDMACDSRAGLAMPDDQIARHRQLMAEAFALFGARHFREYHFLLSLSDHVAHFGLEHHEASDDRTWERTWLDDDLRIANSNLLAHELVHSWNGKFRRPAGLATRDFQQPMKDDLLWVYEGLTQYLGFVLAARSGIRTPEQARESLARAAAALDRAPGRAWRPLIDTAVEAQLLYGASDQWSSWRRGVDFYDEGLLIWLEADVQIRKLTGGRRSLDDFCRRFHGGASGPPRLETYTLDDVLNTLNGIAPFDWRAFFDARIESLNPRAPLGGLEGGGWKLDYGDSLPGYMRSVGTADKQIDLRFSLGVMVGAEDGLIVDAIPGSAAAKAGVAPGMKLVGVNGRHWSKEALIDAVAASRNGQPLELLLDNGEFFRTCRLDYRGGPRYPRLVRDPGKPDLLSDILRAHAAGVKSEPKP